MLSNKYLIPTFYLVIFVIVAACNSNHDFEKYRTEILNLNKEMINAHLNKDIEWFTKDIADDYFSVGRGEIRHPKPGEITANFSNYLNNTEFSEYRDLQEPIIEFSKDGTLAWLIVQVKVAGERKMETDSIHIFDVTWAWITLYEREEDKWIRLGEVSNYK